MFRSHANPIRSSSRVPGKAPVASGRFPTGSTFHFVLSPGRYTITDNAAYPTGTPFHIQAHHLTHVVVVDSCG